MNTDLLYLISGGTLLLCSVGIVCMIRWRRGWRKRKGRKGEMMVAKELSRLKRRENVVFNDVILPGTSGRTSQIDHIVVSTRGIFLIETKSHSGAIYGGEHYQYWTQCLGGQKRNLYNPLLQNNGHLRALRKLLPDIDRNLFVSMIVFTEATRLGIKADDIVIERSFLPDRHIRRTFIPSERRKRRWLWPWGEVRLDEANIVTPLDGMVAEIRRRKQLLNRDEVDRIAEAISEKAMPGGGTAERAHTAYAKETAKRVSRSIRQGNCPRCGSWLVVMKGDKGEFLSCSNFPACRFTSRLDT